MGLRGTTEGTNNVTTNVTINVTINDTTNFTSDIINRPSVAGAVLQTPLLLINCQTPDQTKKKIRSNQKSGEAL